MKPADELTTGRIASNAAWIYGRMLAVQAVNLAAVAVLARQLDARDFGIAALASVVIVFLQTVGAHGVNQYVIYDRAEGHELRARAAFWLGISIAVMTAAIGLIAAEPVSRFFGEPQLALIISVLLIRFPIEVATRFADSVLAKALQFRSVELRDTAIQIAAAALSIWMAFAGYGVWSLVWPHVLLAPVQLIAAFASSAWRPGWRPRFDLWPPILRYAGSVIGGAVTSFAIIEGDTLLVGRVLGPVQLGIYNLAWRSSNLVSRNVVNLSNKLSFPILARAADDRAKLVDTLRLLLRLVSAITFPLLVLLFVLADDFILVIYGEKWAASVLPLRILIVYAMRYSIGSPLGPVFNAIGRPDLVFKLQSAVVPIYALGIWIGSAYGIVGVAAAVTIVRTGFGAATFRVAAGQLGVRVGYLLSPMRGALIAALLTGAAVWAVKWVVTPLTAGQGVYRLMLLGALGGAMHLAIVRAWFPEVAGDFQKFLGPLLSKGRYRWKQIRKSWA